MPSQTPLDGDHASMTLATGATGPRRTAPAAARLLLRLVLFLAIIAGLGWVVAGPAVEVHGQGATATPVLRTAGKFEENDGLLIYSGTWVDVRDTRASGGTLRRASSAGTVMEFTFPGPNVRWFTTRGPSRGMVRVFVDGQDKGQLDLYATSDQFNQEFSYGGLDGNSSHTIRLEVIGTRNGASNGTNIDVDYFIAAGAVAPTLYRFEDTDPALTYGGSWLLMNHASASGGTVNRSNSGGAATEFRFTGTMVTFVTSRGPDRGIVRIIIDGEQRQQVDLFQSSEKFQEEIIFNGLSDGAHTIRVESTGTRGGAATDSFVDIDLFIVLGASTTPVPTRTATATPTATPAATATLVATATPLPTPFIIPTTPPGPRDNRFFGQTNYRIDYDPFWNYFTTMGGVDTFGYPVSRTFPFLGCTTQFYQRQLMQQCGVGGEVRTMNLLDPDLMPYNQINFSTFPRHDSNVASAAPGPGTPNYGQAVLNYIRSTSPDTFDGLPVRFFSTFARTVPGTNPDVDATNAALVNLQIWGFPTSAPAYDPANRGFVYQRFQRGIMHFDAATGGTRGILLSDYFKSVITGRNLPGDLAAQAAGGRFLVQYCPGRPGWVCRPELLASTDLSFAFEQQ